VIPCLPDRDPHPDRRASGLHRRRGEYAFDWSYQGIAAVAHLPLHERADVRWWAGVAEKVAQVEANKVAGKLPWSREGTEPLAPWSSLYHTLPTPPVVSVFGSDATFAWQAVAGPNPTLLQRLRRPLDHFRVGPAEYRAAVGDADTFEAAFAEGRLYVLDYAMLDGLAEGTVDGLPKVNFAPIALYTWLPRRNALLPVAIQCTQRPSRLWTPQDGTSWKMARTAVSTADGNHQGIVSHFALCHQVMESVIVATRRQLSDHHPLAVLLEPHFRDTLITNDIARTSLVGPGGNMERLQSPTLDASLGLARDQLAAFRLSEASPPEDFAARGVDDPTTLGDYPARDDALPLWAAVRRWVLGYVGLYYATDEDVVTDPELAAWVDELGAETGGRLQGLSRPTTVAAVGELVARIVYRCTGWHAQFNYSSYDLFSYAPNTQVASFAPGPVGGDAEAAWLAMFPPPPYASEALALFWQITLQLTSLGQYPDDHFTDARVAPLLAAHQSELAEVESATVARDAGRLLSYPYLRPSRVPLSIHV
jgi:arachidonate 15-lipoxygenase